MNSTRLCSADAACERCVLGRLTTGERPPSVDEIGELAIEVDEALIKIIGTFIQRRGFSFRDTRPKKPEQR